MKIFVDFLGGSHGNYLTFLLNKLILGNLYPGDDPFTDIGTSHDRVRSMELPVFCWHWSQPNFNPTHVLFDEDQLDYYSLSVPFPKFIGNNVIRISVTKKDIPALYQLHMHRMGDRNIDLKKITTDMFDMYSKPVQGHSSIRDLNTNELKNFNLKNETVTLDLYNIIRDESKERQENWPAITQPSDFHDLTAEIQQEYISRFGQPFFGVSEEYPNCSKNIIRHHYKNEFRYMTSNSIGFGMDFDAYSKPLENKKVYYLPYSYFYEKDKFLTEIVNIKDFFGLVFTDFDISKLHDKFLERQPYRNTANYIEDILYKHIAQNKQKTFPNFTIIEEAFINSEVEKIYNIELPVGPVEFPKSVFELIKQYGLAL